MKDLDFDELDQAVSSVLGSRTTDKKEEAAPADAAPVATPSAPAAPDTGSPAPATPTPAETKPAPAVSPAVKRRGQFLDMVHPSADMTSRTTMPTTTTRTKITPVSKDITPEPANEPKAVEAPATPVSAPAPSEKVEDEALEPTKTDVAWPDPLDVMQSADTDEKPSNTSTEDAEPAAPAASPATDVPATTPFVTDAKVDKRPLGAFGTAETAPATEETPEKPTESVDEQKAPDTTPPELQPDVVSVEAAAEREFTGGEAEEPEQDEKPATNMAQSIPQQYKTPAQAPDTTPHPVFNTEEYHQPLLPAHGQKKGHGWLIVLIIVLLLIVGAALGYFAFVAGL